MLIFLVCSAHIQLIIPKPGHVAIESYISTTKVGSSTTFAVEHSSFFFCLLGLNEDFNIPKNVSFGYNMQKLWSYEVLLVDVLQFLLSQKVHINEEGVNYIFWTSNEVAKCGSPVTLSVPTLKDLVATFYTGALNNTLQEK